MGVSLDRENACCAPGTAGWTRRPSRRRLTSAALGASVGAAATRDGLDRAARSKRSFARACLAGQEERLAALITARPDATLAELRDALPTTAALSTLWRAIDRLGFTRQKKRYTPTNNAGLMSPRRGASGATWQPLRDMAPVRLPRRMRRDDGSAAALRPQSRAARACTITRPCGHWETHTVVAALRLDGLGAPAVFDGPIDTPTLPRLRRAGPRPDAAPGRCRRARQPRGPQTAGGPHRDRSRRRAAPLSAALQSGLQSDRARLRQTESLPPRRAPRSFDQVCDSSRPRWASSRRRSAATSCGTAAIASLRRYENCSSDAKDHKELRELRSS